MFDPQFPLYLDHIRICNGVIKSVPLDFKDGKWRFDPDQVRATLTKDTKIFIFNNCHNPTGKVFTREEMEVLSKIFDEFPQLVVISDDVYDYLTFDDNEYILFASVLNNWERTISIFSGGKLFNCTGWKIGWSIARPELLRLGAIMSNTIYYTTNTPAQIAMSKCFEDTIKPGFHGDLSYLQY